jgi:hypothetical protein
MCAQSKPELHSKLADPSLNLAIQNHEYGLPPPFYQRWPVLGQWYNILTTTKDRKGVEYVSTMEGKHYPFFGAIRPCGLYDMSCGGALGGAYTHTAGAWLEPQTHTVPRGVRVEHCCCCCCCCCFCKACEAFVKATPSCLSLLPVLSPTTLFVRSCHNIVCLRWQSHPPTQPLILPPIHPRSHSSYHPFTHSATHPTTHSPTQI